MKQTLKTATAAVLVTLSLAGCAGAAAGGHSEGVLGLQDDRVEMVHFLEEHRHLHGLEEVLAVVAPRAVGGERHIDSCGQHL